MAEPTGDVRGGAEQSLWAMWWWVPRLSWGKGPRLVLGGPGMKSRGDHLLTWMHCPTPGVVTHFQLPFAFLMGSSMGDGNGLPISISKLGGHREEPSFRASVQPKSGSASRGPPPESQLRACRRHNLPQDPQPFGARLWLGPGYDLQSIAHPLLYLSPSLLCVPISKAAPSGSTSP